MSCLLPHELAHAGGWDPSHAGAIYTKECGHLPMPPRSFPLNGKKVAIHYVSPISILFHCGPNVQACTWMGSNPVIYLPNRK